MKNQKLRKMLGDINSKECIELMHLIETQNKQTLSVWAVTYAKTQYLPVFREICPDEMLLDDTIAICERYLADEIKLAEVKPLLRESRQLAAQTEDLTAQAAARAVATACAAVLTPTNAFGYLLYGAAAVAYHDAGLKESQEVYDRLAEAELRKALESLQKVAVPDEKNPVKINWNC